MTNEQLIEIKHKLAEVCQLAENVAFHELACVLYGVRAAIEYPGIEEIRRLMEVTTVISRSILRQAAPDSPTNGRLM